MELRHDRKSERGKVLVAHTDRVRMDSGLEDDLRAFPIKIAVSIRAMDMATPPVRADLPLGGAVGAGESGRDGAVATRALVGMCLMTNDSADYAADKRLALYSIRASRSWGSGPRRDDTAKDVLLS